MGYVVQIEMVTKLLRRENGKLQQKQFCNHLINMRNDKESAIKMRLQGKSYGEIRKKFGIPKSTLSVWLGDVVLSKKARAKIRQRTQAKGFRALIRRNKNQTVEAKRRVKQLRLAGKKAVGKVSLRDIFIIGSVLYWAEGYKRPVRRKGREVTHHVVSLTNSDPVLVKTFLRYLHQWCKVPKKKIKASVRVFPRQSMKKLQYYWERQTGLGRKNFFAPLRTISIFSRRKRQFDHLPHGVIQIRVANTALFHTIMGYIAGIKKLV